MTTEHRAGSAPAGGRLVEVGLRRFDPLLRAIVGVFGVLYALQTADSFVADLPTLSNPLGVVVIVLVVLSVLTGVGALVAPARASVGFLAGAGLYAIAVLLWPFAIQPPIPTDPMPWLVAVWPVPAAYLALGARTRVLPIVIASALSIIASVTLQFSGGLDPADALVDSAFMTGTAVVLVVLLGAVRRGVVAAAQAQQAALNGYASTRIDDASEEERKRTDALMHDVVLTTFLSAAAARTPEAEELARRMAKNSLRVLMHVNGVGREGTPVVSFGQAVTDEHEQLAALLARFDVDLAQAESVLLPHDVSRAVISVVVECLRNSVQHADGATRRSVRAQPLGPDGIRVTIEDDGCGFDLDEVRSGGAGYGVKVVNRLRGLEGRVDVRTAPHEGTTVTVSWGSVVISGTALPTHEDAAVPR